MKNKCPNCGELKDIRSVNCRKCSDNTGAATKLCPSCNETKPISEFGQRYSKSKKTPEQIRPKSHCKACENLSQKERYINKPIEAKPKKEPREKIIDIRKICPNCNGKKDARCKLCQECRVKCTLTKTHKICSMCKENKPRSEYGIRKNRNNQPKPYCFDCNKIALKGKYKKVKDEDRKHIVWDNSHPDTPKLKNYYSRMKRLGLMDEKEKIIAAFNSTFTCEICNKECNDSEFRIDHCHDSLKFRGLLCDRCNLGIGMFYDNPDVLVKAATYLQKNKT